MRVWLKPAEKPSGSQVFEVGNYGWLLDVPSLGLLRKLSPEQLVKLFFAVKDNTPAMSPAHPNNKHYRAFFAWMMQDATLKKFNSYTSRWEVTTNPLWSEDVWFAAEVLTKSMSEGAHHAELRTLWEDQKDRGSVLLARESSTGMWRQVAPDVEWKDSCDYVIANLSFVSKGHRHGH